MAAPGGTRHLEARIVSACLAGDITWVADTYALHIPVTYSDTGEAVDLTGATVEGAVQRGDRIVVPVVTIDNALEGLLRVEIDRNALSPGPWRLQVRVTRGSETQTVYDGTLSVHPSIIPG